MSYTHYIQTIVGFFVSICKIITILFGIVIYLLYLCINNLIMEKYYTPEIEELYVGFECQHTTNMSAFKINDTDRIYNSPLIIHELCDYITWSLEEGLDKFVRVKYLDQEDIESLGFILKGKSIDLWFQREGIYLRDDGHHLKNIMLQYGKHDQRLRITFLYTSGEEQIHFEGKIKNKSELKKLIKQLEIEQDGRSSFY